MYVCWSTYVCVQAAAVARSRTRQQFLRSSVSSWQVFVKHQQQKATADTYAGSRLQQRVFLAWVEEACQARSKAHAAVNMAARVQARMHNQLVFECFAAWRTQSQQAAAFKVGMQSVKHTHIITKHHTFTCCKPFGQCGVPIMVCGSPTLSCSLSWPHTFGTLITKTYFCVYIAVLFYAVRHGFISLWCWASAPSGCVSTCWLGSSKPTCWRELPTC